MANSLSLNFTIICMMKEPISYEDKFIRDTGGFNKSQFLEHVHRYRTWNATEYMDEFKNSNFTDFDEFKKAKLLEHINKYRKWNATEYMNKFGNAQSEDHDESKKLDFDEYIHRLKKRNAEPEPIYSLNEKSWLFSAVAVGNIIGTIPLTWSNNRFGVRKTFFIYGLTSGIATFLIPLSVSMGFVPVFIMRALQGFGLTISFTAMGAIVSAWSSLQGAGIYISILSMHIQLGAIVAMPTSGALCQSSLGWPAVYYILGILTILSFILFFIFYRNQPQDHFLITEKELNLIKKDKVMKSGGIQKIPYKDILRDIPTIGVLVYSFGGSLSIQMMYQYGPTYLNKVLGFSITKTGFAAALPYVLSIVVKLFAGPISDLVTCVSQRGRVIIFNTLSQLPICICFILMASLPLEMAWLVQITYSLMNAFSGLSSLGAAKSVQLTAQHHAHFVMTLISLVNSIVMLILPIVVTIIAPDNTESQWATVFYILAAIVFVTMMFFNFVCQVEPRYWTKSESVSPVEDTNRKPSQTVTVRRESSSSVCKVSSNNLHSLELNPIEDKKVKNKKVDINIVA